MSFKTNERMNIQKQTCPRSWVNWGSLLSSTRFNQVISRIHFFGLGSTAFKSNAAPPVNEKQEKKEKNKKKTVIINRLKATKRFKMTLAFVVSFFLISLFALRWSCFKILSTIKGSSYVSGQLPTHLSPKPTFYLTWEVSVNVGLGNG